MRILRVNDQVEFIQESTTFGRIVEIKGLVFKKYYVYYWGEQNGWVTDPWTGTYSRWCKPNEIRKRQPKPIEKGSINEDTKN